MSSGKVQRRFPRREPEPASPPAGSPRGDHGRSCVRGEDDALAGGEGQEAVVARRAIVKRRGTSPSTLAKGAPVLWTPGPDLALCPGPVYAGGCRAGSLPGSPRTPGGPISPEELGRFSSTKAISEAADEGQVRRRDVIRSLAEKVQRTVVGMSETGSAEGRSPFARGCRGCPPLSIICPEGAP